MCLECEGMKSPTALLGSLICYLGVEQASSLTQAAFYVPASVSDPFVGQVHREVVDRKCV